jgi:hypothetical protein
MATTPARTQTLIFQPFDGKKGADAFFAAVRERAYTGVSYPPECITGTLPIAGNDENILPPEQILKNSQYYATLYHEMARSLTGMACITQKVPDV